jgi:signal transduction histidine kinase
MRWPLSRQIMLPLLGVAVASLAAVGAINAQLAARQTRERIDRQLQGVVTVLSATNFPLTDSVLTQMRELSGAEFVVTDASGAPQTASLSQQPPLLPLETDLAVASGEAAGLLGSRLEVNGESYFHRVTRLPTRVGSSGDRWLHVLFPESEYRRSWREAFLPPLIVGAATIAAVAIVASLLGRRISRAATRLGGDVLRMARGDFSPAALPTTDDEIRDLSEAVNRTAEMLTEYEQQVRRTEQMRTVALLGAGLAHEMRNAATGCRMALDLHAESCSANGEDETLTVAKRQLRLMESQLQRFLRASKETPSDVRREIDLANVVDDLLQLVRPAARHAGVELQWERAVDAMPVMGDDEALGQVVLNLLLNAIEAVQQPGGATPREVRAELRAIDGEAVAFIVSDNGPGPQSAVAGSVFDPFVTTKPEGVGLGLAVAKQVVEAHHGTIDWTRANGVTNFRVEIPLAMKGKSCV